MSTLAVWLFVALGLALLGALGGVVRAAVAVVRKLGRLNTEFEGLQHDLDAAVGSRVKYDPDARPAQPHRSAQSAVPHGYHRRDVPRQEEVDHG